MFFFVEPDCPAGKLVNMRGYRSNHSYVILAYDCYILNSLLRGAKETIETIFSQSKLRTTQEQNRQCELSEENGNCNSTDLKLKLSDLVVYVIELTNKVTQIEKERKEDRVQIKTLN